jgi:transposase
MTLPTAQALLEPIRSEAVVAEKAFDADPLLDCIKCKEQRPFDQYQYRNPNRNVVESFLARLKQFRCIATRYDKLASRFASFAALVAAFLWLK